MLKDMMSTESDFDEDFDDIFPLIFPSDFSSNVESTSSNLLLPISVNESNDQYSLSLHQLFVCIKLTISRKLKVALLKAQTRIDIAY